MNHSQSLEPVVDLVSMMLDQRIGLRPEPSLRSRLRRCIRDDAASRRQSPADYLETLRSEDDALQRLFDRVTVQETSFFRHPEHFEVLARDILPTLQGPLTLWSAACANGQEAFSLAMVLEELDLEGYVLASDLSTSALRRTETAHYTARELAGLSADRIARHLTRDGDGWQINGPVRDRVRIRQHNLLDTLPDEVRSAQVIFCRNVLIYFTVEHATAFLNRVADAAPAVSLFLGAAETIWQLTDRFETVRIDDTFTYRRRSDAADRLNRMPARQLPRVPERRPALEPKPVPAPRRVPPAASRPSKRAAKLPTPTPAADEPSLATLMERAGQIASAAGDIQSAIVAFRKCAYLTPHDPMTHLHLGLALETAGDHHSARRAYAAARHALLQCDPDYIGIAIEGYTIEDLLRLLDSKQQVLIP